LFDPLEEIKEKFDWVIETEEKCNQKQSTVRERMDRCMQVLDYLYEDERVDVFLEPVTDAVAPGYSDIVTDPMDLGKVEKRLEEFYYEKPAVLDLFGSSAIAFCADVRLVWSNCCLYNDKSSEIAQYATALSKKFDFLFEQLVVELVRVKTVEKQLDATFRSGNPSHEPS
jgi:hypothetical protein